MPGEDLHIAGQSAMRRAKVWLDRTTRVRSSWMVTDAFGAPKLTYSWPFGGNSFSFDIGGIHCGEDLEGQSFLAEVKGYTTSADQGTLYREYLAKCYVTRQANSGFAERFMWITWCPFNVTTWNALHSPNLVRESVLSERERVLGKSELEEAEMLIDDSLVVDVANRLSVIVLSEAQEQLVISAAELGQLERFRREQGL